ncbi:MAG: hypothetical protein M9904_12775 [Chitinophagaceae bacterium]|nr:hypothetical protein [Chitinophagaceae bacterium]
MKKTVTITLLGFYAIALFFSTGCKKNNTDSHNSKSQIYVGGSDANKAVLWKNGSESALSLSRSTGLSDVRSVFISDNDVYAVGYEGSFFPKLWKNGIEMNLNLNGRSNGSASSVYVSNNDVYVAGTQDANPSMIPLLWKNGQPNLLSSNPDKNPANDVGEATSVFVSDNNVYVAGWTTLVDPSRLPTAILWKNNEIINLSFGIYYQAMAWSVFVSGNDAYTVGYEKETDGRIYAIIWKNRLGTRLTNGATKAYALSVFVSGSDVYVAGYEENSSGNKVAMLWKNGESTHLTSGATDASANAIYVYENDVYVAGYEENSSGNKVAMLWENSIAKALSDGNSNAIANTIFVQQ